MKHSTWQVRGDYGYRALSTISEEVLLWNHWGPEYEQLEIYTEARKQHATDVGKIPVSKFFASSAFTEDIPSLAATVGESIEHDFVEAALAIELFKRVKQLKHGTEFNAYGKRAKLIVVQEGVRRQTRILEPGHGINIPFSKDPNVPEGTIFEGKIRGFTGSPELGGFMRLQHGGDFLTSFLQGLVGSNGTHRVELEILDKKRRQKQNP